MPGGNNTQVLKINGKRRLTKAELEDILENSGITRIQGDIVRLRYYDRDEYSVVKICDKLSISERTYGYQLRQAVRQINSYWEAKK